MNLEASRFVNLQGIMIICLWSVCDLCALFIIADIKGYSRDLILRALANKHYHLVEWVACHLPALISPSVKNSTHTFFIILLIFTQLFYTPWWRFWKRGEWKNYWESISTERIKCNTSFNLKERIMWCWAYLFSSKVSKVSKPISMKN